MYLNNSYNNNTCNNSNSNNSNSNNTMATSPDPNYNILKREFNNLYNNTILLNESIKNYCFNIKDIYLNSNGLLSNIKNNYSYEHPLSGYSESLLNSVVQSFDEWIINQQSTLDSISNYCDKLKDVDLQIQKLDSLELDLLSNKNNNNNQQQQKYISDKESLFQDVKYCFDNKMALLDIPIINFQFSIHSLFQCLNNIHSSTSNDYLLPYQNNSLPYYNPISNLNPINNFQLNNNSINNNSNSSLPQKPQPSPFNLKKRPVSINNNITPILNQNNENNNNNNITKQRSQSVFNEPPIIKPRPAPIVPVSNQNTDDQSPKPLRPAPPIPKESIQQTQQPIIKPRPLSTYGNIQTQQPPPPPIIKLKPAPPIPNKDIQQESSQQAKPLRPAPLPRESIQQTQQTQQVQQPQLPIIKPKPLPQTSYNKPPPPIIKQQPEHVNNNTPPPRPPRPAPIPNQPQSQQQPQQKQQQTQQYNNNNNNNKFLKSNPFIIPDNSKLHPTIDQHLFDLETHKRMWNRHFKINKVYQYTIRFTHTKEIGVEEGQLNVVKYYWFKPINFQFQEITSSICQLVDNITGKVINAVEVPTCLYNCYKIEYSKPPPKSRYTLYHITECNLYSNELEEVNDPREIPPCEPITEKEIKVFTRCEEEITFDTLEFKQFIDQHKLYPLETRDGTLETTLCFAYRVSLFIYKHITYDINSRGQTALVTFSKKTANCESFSNMFASILRYNKIPVRYLSGKSVDKDQNHTFGKHAQTEFYCPQIGWVPYNGAARDCHVYNKFAFGRNKGDLFVQEAHYVTDMEHGKGKFLSIVLPASSFNFSQKVKWAQPIDTLDLDKLNQA